ncbi:MAG: transglycosylase SLT domain-containing protein, partial [Candidatus Poribacteria bacterium]
RPLVQFQLLTELMPDAYAVGVESAWRRFSLRAGIRSSTEPLAARETAAYGVTLNVTPGSAVHYAYGFDTARFSEGTHSLSFDLPLWPSGGGSSAPARSTHAARVPSVSDNSAQGGPSPSRAPTSVLPVAQVPGTPVPERIVKSAIDRTPDIPGNTRRSLRRLIEHHSKKYGVETPLILAMMWAESGYDPAAISASKAVGLFQLLPPAARDMGIEIPPNALLDRRRDGRFHPVRNADAGIRYMAHLLQRFDWNYVLAISAYNAGPGNVNGGVPRRRETERHVGRVLNYYYRYRNDPAQLAAAWRTIEAIPIPN